MIFEADDEFNSYVPKGKKEQLPDGMDAIH